MFSPLKMPAGLSPGTLVDLDIHVNASTTWDIGLVVGSRWAAWRCVDGWKAAGQDIGWAESIALEIAVMWALASGLTDTELVIHGDNMSIICAFQKGRS